MTLLYINGDSHSIGHGVEYPGGMAEDDPAYAHLGEAPHPSNYPHSYSYLLGKHFSTAVLNQSRSGGSIDRVIRTTRQFLAQYCGNVLVVIGWPSFEREEWSHNNVYYQINAGGHTIVPPELQTRYKNWVTVLGATWDQTGWQETAVAAHNKIHNFHIELEKKGVKHLFFNTIHDFQVIPENDRKDFGKSFVIPYDSQETYYNWLANQGFVHDDWFHFGKDAHAAWAKHLRPFIFGELND